MGTIETDVKLTADIFKQLGVDGSGAIDVGELKAIFGNNAAKDIDVLMQRADLDGNGELDYAEYERVMNMQKFGDEQGGNLYVRNAIGLGLLKQDSILADGEASLLVGNKGFDPLNCATNIETLKKYREAELKHRRLARLRARAAVALQGRRSARPPHRRREGPVARQRWPRQDQPALLHGHHHLLGHRRVGCAQDGALR